MEMSCDVYVNNKGFKVGRKYLYIADVYRDRIIKKVELTPELVEKLGEIKEKYSSIDANRTNAVLNLVD